VRIRAPDLGAAIVPLLGASEENSRAPNGAAACDELSSLEVRWIFPGELKPAVAGWFGQFPARTETREDRYLVDSRLRGLSVKIRGNVSLEVKAYCGSQGILKVPGHARGHMQAWHKWSIPLSRQRPDRAPAGWRQVRKTRRLSRFVLASGEFVADYPELRQQPGCGVELTEIRTQGQDWWSLGFEASGPSDLLRSELAATAALVFAQPAPAVEPGPDDFASYAQWLARTG
jgi:hypothetical protein